MSLSTSRPKNHSYLAVFVATRMRCTASPLSLSLPSPHGVTAGGRAAVAPPGLPMVTRAVRAARLLQEGQKSANIHGRSAVIRGIRDKDWHWRREYGLMWLSQERAKNSKLRKVWTAFGQMFRCPTFGIACTLLPLAMTAAHSETADQMQAIMSNPKAFCLRENLHEYADESYHECLKYDGLKGSQCVDEVTRRNDIIGKWNTLVRGCKPSGNTASGSSNFSKTKGPNDQPNDMANRVEAAKKKAVNADAAKKAALEKMRRDEQTDQEERRKLDEDLRKQEEHKAAIAKQAEQEKQPSIFPNKFPPLPLPPLWTANSGMNSLLTYLSVRDCVENAAGTVCQDRSWKHLLESRGYQGIWSAGVCYDVRGYTLRNGYGGRAAHRHCCGGRLPLGR